MTPIGTPHETMVNWPRASRWRSTPRTCRERAKLAARWMLRAAHVTMRRRDGIVGRWGSCDFCRVACSGIPPHTTFHTVHAAHTKSRLPGGRGYREPRRPAGGPSALVDLILSSLPTSSEAPATGSRAGPARGGSGFRGAPPPAPRTAHPAAHHRTMVGPREKGWPFEGPKRHFLIHFCTADQ